MFVSVHDKSRAQPGVLKVANQVLDDSKKPSSIPIPDSFQQLLESTTNDTLAANFDKFCQGQSS